MGARYRRCLVRVDQSCGELAGLIDAEGAVEELALCL